jgi:hypothetical protein
MWAGVMPLILSLASALASSPERFCGTGPCETGALLTSFAFYGNVLFSWLADIAVPLAVMVTTLLAFTLGYLALIGRLVQFTTKRFSG